MKKLARSLYTKEYFCQRDILSPHIGHSIKIFMDDNGLKKVLDVGCGTGRLVNFLNQAGFAAIGCDSQGIAVEAARKINGKKTIFKATATKLPFKSGSFDLITAISVIEHLTISQAHKFLKEAKRLLKPGGFIFMITPNYTTPIRIIQGERWFGYRDPTHITFFTPNSLAKLLKSEGFSNIKFNFKIKYDPSFDWEFPSFFAKFPKFLKYILIYLFFSPPFSFAKNSFWIAARKYE